MVKKPWCQPSISLKVVVISHAIQEFLGTNGTFNNFGLEVLSYQWGSIIPSSAAWDVPWPASISQEIPQF